MGKTARQCAKHTQRPGTRRIQGHTHRLMQTKKFGPVLNIGIATFVDISGIEMQVPSLSTPERSIWILRGRGHERFVNEIHRHNSKIVNYSSSLRTKDENFDNVGLESSKPAVVNHGQGSQDSNNVETKDEPPSVLREIVASTIRETLASSKSSRRRQRR